MQGATMQRTKSDPSTGTPETDPAELLRMYRQLLTTRLLDEEAIAMQRQGILPAYVPVRGQEAAQVGSAGALDRARDFAFPTYRELGAAVALNVDPVSYLANHRALWNGGTYNPVTTRFANINAIVGAPVLHAVGWAMGAAMDETGGAAIAYFGDGASSQGDVHEAMNAAGLSRAPVVFFCQNNGWAISVPTERQVAGGSVAARANGYGMPGHTVDGNDVQAVRHATQQALDRARAGEGPTLIEALTYRVGPHATSDDPSRYRSREEERRWSERDPVTAFRSSLTELDPAAQPELERLEHDAQQAVAEVREGLRAAPSRPGEELFEFVYRNPTAALRAQQQARRVHLAATGAPA